MWKVAAWSGPGKAHARALAVPRVSHNVAGAAPIGWRRRLARLWPQRSQQSYFVAVILLASLPIARVPLDLLVQQMWRRCRAFR